MAETGIRFMTFGISPYCEKARWALDWHRIRYREIGWPPGLHQILAKRCGAKTSALPILFGGHYGHPGEQRHHRLGGEAGRGSRTKPRSEQRCR